MANHSRPVVLERPERVALRRLQRSPTTPSGISQRARVILLLADQIPGTEVAELTGYTPVQISRHHPVSNTSEQVVQIVLDTIDFVNPAREFTVLPLEFSVEMFDAFLETFIRVLKLCGLGIEQLERSRQILDLV